MTTAAHDVPHREGSALAVVVRRASAPLLLLLTSWLIGGGPALAADRSIEAFFGTYEGRSVSANDEGFAARDMRVVIAATKSGFNVTWNTVTHGADGKAKVKEYSIDFEPTQRPGIFGSEMRRNMFGHRVPLDPLQGDPYVWARITGDVLTVYALHITAEGGYEMQVYHRTLTAEGLDVRFTRFREDQPLRGVTGTLVRVGR